MSRDYVLEPFRASLRLQIDYAGELNAQQYLAVTAAPGPALVIAGAGTGKTRTLTYRVAYLLEQGVPADKILLLTFTNKAANEMMRRVADLFGQELSNLWGGTFHSIGHRLLRRHAELVGYRSDFTILDREDAEHLLNTCLAEAQIDTKSGTFPKAEALAGIFSLALNTHRTIPQLLEERLQHFQSCGQQMVELYATYQARKRSANVMDFDDLLVLWLKLFRDQQDLRERYQQQFQFILVDEYQDTNQLQSELIDLLAARHQNLMVVGDESQSIYSWRGANFKNILEFPQRYPRAAIYKIETNYRSTPEILELANAAIAPNERQFAKHLVSARKSGSKPVVVACVDAYMQAAFVAQRIAQLHEEGLALAQIAILYRSHFHAMELQMELTRRQIPFSITSGIRFFEQAHIKDVTAYLKLIANPRDEVAFKRLVMMLPGVGTKGAAKLWRLFRGESGADDGMVSEQQTGKPSARESKREGAPTIRTLSFEQGGGKEEERRIDRKVSPTAANDIIERLRVCGRGLSKKTLTYWPQYYDTLSQLVEDQNNKSPAELIRMVLEAGYEDYLWESYEHPQSRLEDLEQLAGFAEGFPDLHTFLSQLALLSNLEAEGRGVEKEKEDRIIMSTIHQAKGLEFDVVFLIMLCDGLFPTARSLENPDQEEERRLFYVGITRARNELYLSYPFIRSAAGFSDGKPFQPSRFLRGLPPETMEEWNLRDGY